MARRSTVLSPRKSHISFSKLTSRTANSCFLNKSDYGKGERLDRTTPARQRNGAGLVHRAQPPCACSPPHASPTRPLSPSASASQSRRLLRHHGTHRTKERRGTCAMLEPKWLHHTIPYHTTPHHMPYQHTTIPHHMPYHTTYHHATPYHTT